MINNFEIGLRKPTINQTDIITMINSSLQEELTQTIDQEIIRSLFQPTVEFLNPTISNFSNNITDFNYEVSKIEHAVMGGPLLNGPLSYNLTINLNGVDIKEIGRLTDFPNIGDIRITNNDHITIFRNVKITDIKFNSLDQVETFFISATSDYFQNITT